jgi:TRAP-type C4-dicarboxylate transport system permease small subunit
MDRLIAGVRAVSRWGVWFGGALIVLAAVLVGVEVLIRKAFNLTIGGVDELSGFALAISTAWAFGFALLDRAHVRIDSLYVWLPTRVRILLDILGLVVFTLFMALFAWQAQGVFLNSLALDTRTMTVLATPLKYPQFLWVLGLYFFVVIAVVLLLGAALALARGELGAVQQLIGSRTVGEELDEELQQVERLRAERSDPHDQA